MDHTPQYPVFSKDDLVPKAWMSNDIPYIYMDVIISPCFELSAQLIFVSQKRPQIPQIVVESARQHLIGHKGFFTGANHGV